MNTLPAVIETDLGDANSIRTDPVPWPALASCVVLIGAADPLLFDRQPGISVVLFLLLLAACIPVANLWPAPASRIRLTGAAMVVVSLLPLVDSFSALSLSIALSGFAVGVLIARDKPASPVARLAQALRLLGSGPVRFPVALWCIVRRLATTRMSRIHWIGWVLPIGVGLVFVALFQSANPIIEDWIVNIDRLLAAFLNTLTLGRLTFWFAVAAFCWPFLQIHLSPMNSDPLRRSAVTLGFLPDQVSERPATNGRSGLLGSAAITRSLVLFNAVFAVQSILDLVYLWGGATLPDGLTYAAYAHRGAYPLVATALLAGLFVLVALRPGSDTESRPLTRVLILLFVGQNVLLVISSILRLDLYVAEYSLTPLRLSALIWMGLVTTGLALVIVRICFNRTNRWLIAWNCGILAAVLYVCGFINMTDVVARYNVAHSRELSGRGTPLDIPYLLRLGPETIPALDRYVSDVETDGTIVSTQIRADIDLSAELYLSADRDWRSWTLRRARLMRYLKQREKLHTPAPAPASSWR